MANQFPSEIANFLDLSNQLTALMEQELDYLRDKDTDKMQASQKRKEKLTSQYALQMRLLDQKPDLIHNLTKDAKTELIDTTKALQDMSDRNAKVVKATYETGQKIMLVMLEVAKQSNRNVDAYDGGGAMTPHFSKVYGHTPTPLTMDQRL